MNTVEKMLNAIEKINTSLYPLSLIIPITLAIVFITFILINIKKPEYLQSTYLKISIALCYFYAGIPLLFTTGELGVQSIIGGTILIVFGLLFIISIFDKKMVFEVDHRVYIRVISALLMITGIFLYPIIEYFTGFKWPGIAVFGMECPTTITVIGLLILTMKHMPKYLMIILFSNAVITGTSVALMGATFDWSYAISGYIGWVLLVINWKNIRNRTTSAISG